MTAVPRQTAVLRAEHIKYLADRGVTEPVALAAGLRSVTAHEAKLALGYAGPLSSGGFAIPYPNVPTYTRIRMDAGDAKFLAPSGQAVPVYIPPAINLVAAGPLVIVEGPVKALGLVAHGIPAIGLGGTGTTLTTDSDRRLNESWLPVGVSGQSVTVLFDSNRITNANVARDEARLVLALERAGANVLVAELPHRTDGEPWGPDDFLAAHGVGPLSKIIADAVPGAPVKRAEALAAAPAHAQGALLGDVPFRIAVLERGAAARVAVAAALKGVKSADLNRALAEAKNLLKNAHKKAGHPIIDTPEYAVIDGKHCLIETTATGEKTTVLCNFVAKIEREVFVDNGGEGTLFFEIAGETETGIVLPRIRLAPEKLTRESWPLENWGSAPMVAPRARAAQHLIVAMQTEATPVRTTVFAHLGFREINGQWVYLHAGGAVGMDGVEVVVDGGLTHYQLPAPPPDVREGVKLTLRLLEVAGSQLGHLAIATAFRAPLQSMLYCDVAVFLAGQTGSLKTSLAALALAFWGSFDAEHLPVSWASTATSIEQVLFAAKDALVVVDNFVPRSADPNDPMRKTAAQIFQSIGDRSSRSRSRADLSMRPSRPPRALVLSTGEDLPSGSSVLARLFIVEVKRTSVDLTVLTQLQRRRAELPGVMAAYVQFIAASYPAAEAHVQRRFGELRTQAASAGSHLRLPTAVAHLTLGAEMFAAFAKFVGVFSDDEERAFSQKAFNAIAALAAEQADASTAANPARRFLSVVGSLLVLGKVLVLPVTRDACIREPIEKVIEEARKSDEKHRLPPPRELVGWKDEDFYFFDPNATYRAVVEHMKASGEAMPLTATTLWKRLEQMGALHPEGGGHLGVKLSAAGGTRVMRIRRTAIDVPRDDGDGDDDDEPPDGGSGGATPPSGVGRRRSPEQGKVVPQPGKSRTETGRSRTETGKSETETGKRSGSGSERFSTHSSPSSPTFPGFPVSERENPRSASAVAAVRQDANDLQTRVEGTPFAGGGETGEGGERLAEPSGAEAVVHDARRSSADAGRGPLFDTRIAAVLLDGVGPLRKHRDLVEARRARLGLPVGEGGRAVALRGLADEQRESLRQHELDAVAQLEFAIIPAIMDMRRHGVRVDRGKWERLVARSGGELRNLEAMLQAELGIAQVTKWAIVTGLRGLGIDVEKMGRETLLPHIDVPIVRKVVTYNRLRAFMNDQAQAILRALNGSADGRVRADVDQVGAVTGRMTASAPNLLGLPRDPAVRGCFVPADGHVFVCADYKTIELRVAAALTEEPVLLGLYEKEDGDPHRTTAAGLLRKHEDQITDDERKSAKPVNFGALFGITPHGLVASALETGVVLSVAGAERWLNAFRTAYPTLSKWQRDILEENPMVMRTRLGRIRRFSERDSPQARLNFPVQAAAADGMKTAIRLLHPELGRYRGRLLLVVHDELLLEVPEANAEALKDVLVATMIAGMNQIVPGVIIGVDADIRRSWAKGAKEDGRD